jgi:hypothetical protein
MKLTGLVLVSVFIAVASSTAYAQRSQQGFSSGGASDFQANKKFGLGLELGEPSGLNGKYFLSSSHALDFGVGYIYHDYYGDDGIHLYADYLWHPLVLAKADAFELPLYIGVGGRFWQFDYACDRFGCDTASAIGVRVPVGISFDFNRSPIDIFVQLVPTLDFFRSYRDHDVHFGIDGSVGVRFWF